MIQKVIIAEDHQSANISLQKTLEALSIIDVDLTYYCDDALQKIQQACRENKSYDLLITDLYFEKDHRPQKLAGGKELIKAARQIQPDLRVLVFSSEGNTGIINQLYENYHVDGFVRKARRDAEALSTAIDQIGKNQYYMPQELIQAMREKHAFDFTELDITLINLLAKGILQKNIPEYLRSQGIQPAGLSSVEKRLNQLRQKCQVSKNEQLVILCKEKGII